MMVSFQYPQFGSFLPLTRFGQVELLLEQIRNQSEDGDEAAKTGADNVEVVNRKRRHIETDLLI
jgi:hypothetical protein